MSDDKPVNQWPFRLIISYESGLSISLGMETQKAAENARESIYKNIASPDARRTTLDIKHIAGVSSLYHLDKIIIVTIFDCTKEDEVSTANVPYAKYVEEQREELSSATKTNFGIGR